MTIRFFIIRGEKRRHSNSYVEYFQRRRMKNFRSELDYFIFVFGIIQLIFTKHKFSHYETKP